MIRNSITARDGKQISIVEWADVEQPVGIIQIVHGMAEHAMRYDMFAQNMNKRGFIVVADDHRAHGETDKATPGYSEGNIWEKTLGDIEDLMGYAKTKYSRMFSRELKLGIFGHSYGSFLTQEFVKRHGDKLACAVIGGSDYFVSPSLTVGKILTKIEIMFGKEKKPNKFLAKMSFDQYNKKYSEGTFISSIKSECDRYEADKNCGFICSTNFYYNFFKGVKKLYKGDFSKVKDLKILLVSGDCDPVGEMGKGVKNLEKFYIKKGALVKCKLYNGVRHEYLNDTSREDVTKLLGDFFFENITK